MQLLPSLTYTEILPVSPNRKGDEMNNEIQGVISTIDFPLGQDELAISKAIHQLLYEGWEFVTITKTYLRLMRKWEVDLSKNLCQPSTERTV